VSKSAEGDEDILKRLTEAWRGAWNLMPLAGSTPEADAAFALRRWRSFPRRNKGKPDTFAHRVNDLAKGLSDHIEPERVRGYGTFLEYEHLAEHLGRELADAEAKRYNTSAGSEVKT
jgi:hypothetical protein